jgi:ParB-like chromosome segregation protein Spo0J
MLTEIKNITELLPAGYNPRKALKPGDKEYEKLKRSIQQFGYVEPVIWNKRTGYVVGGHQRLTVMKDLGYTEVECVVVDLDTTHEKALNVALNKISGEWDETKLQALFQDVVQGVLSLLVLMLLSRYSLDLQQNRQSSSSILLRCLKQVKLM